MKKTIFLLSFFAFLLACCGIKVKEPADPAPGDPMAVACSDCNEFLLNSEFKTVPSHDGLVSVWGKYAGWTLIDVMPEWETVFPYDTLVMYRSAEGKYGFFDATAGWCRIPPMYDLAWPYSEGVAAVMRDKRVHFIDTLGHRAVGGRSFPYNGHYLDRIVFKNGLCAVANDDRRCGVVDHDGNWVIEPAYHDIMMEDDYIICIAPGVRRQYAYDGTLINGCVVEDTWALKYRDAPTGLFLYEISERLGLMDSRGMRLTEPLYGDIVPISSELFKARLSDEVSYVVLDRKGRVVR